MRVSVLIAGGRNVDQRWAVEWLGEHALSRIRRVLPSAVVVEVIHGAARGADTAGAIWGAQIGAELLAFPADWRRHGTGAGMIRKCRNDRRPPGHCYPVSWRHRNTRHSRPAPRRSPSDD
mgnify:CR=1 FL=1